jgi:N-acetylneuraminic acid mutarotase
MLSTNRRGRPQRKHRTNKANTGTCYRPHTRRRLALEPLEDRIVPTNWDPSTIAQQVVGQFGNAQTQLNGLLNEAAALPLVGQQLAQLSQFTTLLSGAESAIQGLVPTTEPSNTHVQLKVPLFTLTPSFNINLGLDSFLKATGTVSATITPTLNLDFNFDPNTLTPSLDFSTTNLDIHFDVTAPNFQGSLSLDGFLYTTAQDAGTDLSGDLSFGFDSHNNLQSQFSGDAHVLLALTISFVDPNSGASFNPKFMTTLDMNWPFDFGTQQGTNSLSTPSISLKDFSIDVGSLMQGFMGDIVHGLQKFTEPLQPLVDLFSKTEIPLLSNFGVKETLGNLITLANPSSSGIASALDAIGIINSLNPQGSGLIRLGTFNLTGGPSVAGGFNFNALADVGNALQTILGDKAMPQVASFLEQVGVDPATGQPQAHGFNFPLLQNPASVIPAILLGQQTDLFTYDTGPLDINLAPTFGINLGVLGVYFQAGLLLHARLKVGYDTQGLINLLNDPSHSAADLLDGFYIDNSVDTSVKPYNDVVTGQNNIQAHTTGLYLEGLMQVAAEAGAKLSGGIYADVSISLDNTDQSTRVRLDTMIHNLVNDPSCVFDVAGKIYVTADVSLVIPNPLGEDITLFDYNLGYDELLSFQNTCGAPSPPPIQNTILTLPLTSGTDDIYVHPYLTESDDPAFNTKTWYLGIEVDDNGTVTQLPLYYYFEQLNNLANGWYSTTDPNHTVSVPDPNPALTAITGDGTGANAGGSDTIIVDTLVPTGTHVPAMLPIDFNQVRVKIFEGSGNNDLEYRGTGAATLEGGTGNDLLIGSPNSVLVGGGGHDTLEGAGNESAQQLRGIVIGPPPQPNPNDSSLLIGAGPSENLTAGDGNDTLVSGQGDATLTGGLGTDTFIVQGGHAVNVTGGSGDNTLLVEGSDGGVAQQQPPVTGSGGNMLEILGPAPDLFTTPSTQDQFFVNYSHNFGLEVTTAGHNNNLQVSLQKIQHLSIFPGESGNSVSIGDVSASSLEDIQVGLLDPQLDPRLQSRPRVPQTVSVAGSLNTSVNISLSGVAVASGETAAQVTQIPNTAGLVGYIPNPPTVTIEGLSPGDQLNLNGEYGGDEFDVNLYETQTFTTNLSESGSNPGNNTIHVNGSAIFSSGLPRTAPVVDITDNAVDFSFRTLGAHLLQTSATAEVRYNNMPADLTVYGPNQGGSITLDRPGANGNTTIVGGAGNNTITISRAWRTVNVTAGAQNTAFQTTNQVTVAPPARAADLYLTGGGTTTNFDVPFGFFLLGGRLPVLNISGGPNASNVTIDEPVDAGVYGPADSYLVEQNSVSVTRLNSPLGVVYFDQVQFSGLSNLTLNTGSTANNYVTVDHVNNFLSVTIYANGVGGNSVSITPNSQNLGNIVGSVTVNGGGPGPTDLVIDDQNNTTFPIYTVGPASVTRLLLSSVGGSNGTPNLISDFINFSNINSLTLNAAYGANVADTFAIQSPQVPRTTISDMFGPRNPGVVDTVDINGLAGTLELSTYSQPTLHGSLQLNFAMVKALEGRIPTLSSPPVTILDDDGSGAVNGAFDNLIAGVPFVTDDGLELQATYQAAGENNGVYDTQVTFNGFLNDAPLTVYGVNPAPTEGVLFNGVVGSFFDADPSGVAGDYTATISWGDGTATTGTITATVLPGFFSVYGSHTYVEEGSFPVGLTVQDQLGGAFSTNESSGFVNLMAGGHFMPAGSFGADGKLYVFGGLIGNGVTNSSEVYDPAAGTWSSNLPAIPTARFAAATTRGADGQIYIVGGRNQTASALSTAEAFDPASQTWTTGLPGLHTARFGAVAATGPDGTLYVFGGVDPNGTYLSSVEAYKPGSPGAAWTFLLTPMPAAFSDAAAVVGPDGLLYLFGGRTSASTFVNTAYSYNFGTGQWNTLAPLSTPLAEATAAVGPDGRIYVFSGFLAPSVYTNLKTVRVYDPGTNTWGPATPLLAGQAGAVALAGPDGRIYVIGGSNFFGRYPIVAEVYSVGTPVTVADAPLSTSAYLPHIQAGVPFNGVVGSFRDLDYFAVATDYTVTITWGDGTSSAGTVTPIGSGFFGIVGSHTYATEGQYLLGWTVTDQGGAVGIDATTESLSPMPAGVSADAASFGADGKLYVFGGGGGGAYDPTTDTWSGNLPGLPTGRFEPATTRGADGKIYVISGFDQTLFAVPTVEAFDPASQTWTTGLPGLNIPRIGAVAATGPDGTLYVFGGADNNNQYQNSVEAYGPSAAPGSPGAAWTVLGTQMPAGLANPAVVLGPNGLLYFFGGQSSIFAYVNTAYSYDFGTGQWTALASLPTPLGGASAAVGPDGRIYVFGGAVSPVFGNNPTGAVEVYDPGTNSWGPATPLPGPQNGGAALTGPDGRIFLIGGSALPQAYVVGTAALVADAPLAAAGAGASLQAYAGVTGTPVKLASFTDADPAALGSDYTATIYWGDGQVSTGTVQANQSGGFDVSGAHTYAAAGNAAIDVHVADAGGAALDIAASAQIAALVILNGSNLTVQGDAFGVVTNDAITIDNTAAGTQVTVNGMSFSYGPGVIQSITVNPGGGTNTVNVLGLLASVPLVINDPGIDTINIGSDPVNPAQSTLDSIQGPITANGNGATTLNINDQGSTSTLNYELFATQLLRYPAPPPSQGLGNPTLTINYFNVSHLTVQGSTAPDVWYVNSTLAGTTTDLYSNGGTPSTENAFIVYSSPAVLDTIQGPLALHGASGGYDFARAYDLLSAGGHTYTLTTGELQRDGMANLTYDHLVEFTLYADINSYSHTPNTINVQSIGNTFAIIAAGTGDTVRVGQNGTMNNILGTLEIVAGPQQVTLDDSADTQTGKQVTFTTGFYGWGVSGLSPGQVYLPLGTGSSVQVKGGSPAAGQAGSNSYSIQSVPAGIALTLTTGTGGDLVNVGSSANTLDPIHGTLSVAGQGANTSLNFNDQGGTPGAAPNQQYVYSLAQNSFSRTGTGTVTWSSVGAVNLYAANAAGSGSNALDVASTAPGTTYSVYAGTGLNEFLVFDINYTLNGIRGPLFLHGTGGYIPNNDVVFLNDVDKTTRHTFYVNAGATSQSGTVQRVNTASGQPDMAPISYDGLNAYSSLYTAGSAGATINVQSQAANLFTIFGVASSDTVNISSPGHTMAGILGDLRVQADVGQTPTVNLDDSGDSTAHSITVGPDPTDPTTGYLVSGLLPPSSVGRGRLWLLAPTANVSLSGGSGGNTFNIQATSGGMTTINAGSGGDTVNVGSATNRLDPIQGAVTINGNGHTALNVHDDGNPVTENYTVSPSTIQRSIIVAGVYNFNIATITYYTVGHVAVYVGTAKTGLNQGAVINTLDVVGTLAGTVTDLYGNNNGGQTQSSVAPYISAPTSSYNPNNQILGPVHFHGSSIGLDTLSYYDYLDQTAQSYTMTAGQVVDNGFAPVTYDGLFYGVGLITTVVGKCTVSVQSTAAIGFGTQVQTNPGDVVIVGSQAPNLGGSLAGLAPSGRLSIQTTDGNPNIAASVILDDSTDTQTGKQVTFNSDASGWGVSGLAPQRISIFLGTGSSVQVLGGPADKVFHIHDFARAPAVTIVAEPSTSTRTNQHNKLDYSAYTGDVTVDLQLGFATGFSGISHIQDVTGSIGNDILVGDANPNILIGGTGRNLIIGGGAGGDQLTGGGGDNILIAGHTAYDQKLLALETIMKEWLRTDLTFTQRLSLIQNGGDLNEPYLLNSSTVFADTLADTLTGGAGHNWYFAHKKLDTITNFKNGSDHTTPI